MSELHSETNDTNLGLTVRVKLIDLNHTGISTSAQSRKISTERAARERLTAIVGVTGDYSLRPYPAEAEMASGHGYSAGEICMLTGDRIAFSDFENHIESCSICANRVELQLDFMETLEVAMYQRTVDPQSETVRGAMLISTPELNFAVCGELELGT